MAHRLDPVPGLLRFGPWQGSELPSAVGQTSTHFQSHDMSRALEQNVSIFIYCSALVCSPIDFSVGQWPLTKKGFLPQSRSSSPWLTQVLGTHRKGIWEARKSERKIETVQVDMVTHALSWREKVTAAKSRTLWDCQRGKDTEQFDIAVKGIASDSIVISLLKC